VNGVWHCNCLPTPYHFFLFSICYLSFSLAVAAAAALGEICRSTDDVSSLLLLYFHLLDIVTLTFDLFLSLIHARALVYSDIENNNCILLLCSAVPD